MVDPSRKTGSAALGESLRQSEERFRLLIENVRDYAIFLLDTEGRVLTWNPGAERIKGYKAEDIIGRHFKQPKEGLGNDSTSSSHMWRTLIRPCNAL